MIATPQTATAGYGLQARCRELEQHHEERCDAIRNACLVAPHSVADLVPILFTRKLDAHQMSFAFTETLAHVNRLVRRSELQTMVRDGKLFYVPIGPRIPAFP